MTKRTQSRATQFAVTLAKNQAYHAQMKQQNSQRPTALWNKLNKSLTKPTDIFNE